MRAQVICFLALACFPPLWSQPLNKLPDWAMPHVQAVAAEAAPDGADAWVLLDRTQVAYAGDGEIRTRRFRLVKVLSERGLGQGAFILGGLGDQASRVRELRGWNLRPDGDLEKLSKDATATWESGVGGGYSTDQQILAVLPRVTKGSLVAFESLQSFRHPLGPLDATEVLEVVPIRQWELEVVLDAAWFRSVEGVAVNLDLKHFAPWIPAPVVQPGRSVKASNLPALPRGESMHPHAFDQLPFVLVRFLDPRLKETPSLATWDSLAIWLNRQYQERCPRSEASGAVGKGPLEGLKAIHAWMGRDFLYKQVYLTPSRGWLPETAVEVVRKKYGDCKDLAGCFLAEAAGLGVQGSPVLARIGGGEIQPDLPPSLTHDHVVAALRLPQSLGLAAEVETPKGRYLLVDLTDPDTPLGQLGEAHRGRWLMICDPSGALWVRAPEAAILQPRIRVEVTGEVNLGGKLTATVRFVETGDKLDLRSAARGSGKLVDFIAREILDVPPTGSITLVSQSDPRDIHRPFEAVVKVVHPDGFHRVGQEGTFVPWGLPAAPSLIQPAGKPRVQGVKSRRGDVWEFHAEYRVPGKAQPALERKEGETPFRTYAWHAEVRPQDQGTLAVMDFRQQRKDVAWLPPDQEKGVAEARKDRSVLRSIREDGLSLKLVP